MNLLQIAFEPEFEQVVLRMPCEPDHCQQLAIALHQGKLKVAPYFTQIQSDDLFIDAIVEVDGRSVYLFATEEQDEIRMSVSARNLNGLDYTDFRPDLDGAWVEFVQPLRKILEILQ